MTRNDLLQHIPVPLLEELARGRWLPIVGAGFSKNVVVPSGRGPLDWRELGESLAREVPNLSYDTPLDAISSYEHAFGRVALVGKVTGLLRIHDAVPGEAHAAFAKLGFQKVVTTNFDFFLERAYELVRRPCLPLVEEFQLSGHNPYVGPGLLKLHGDVHHPQRMVLTEDDYDGFLGRHPLLATHLAAHLIDHSAVLIGYSLDDPDMRQVLALLRDRLGHLARPLWCLQVDATSHIISRYQRRGVNVINLPKDGDETTGSVLADLFDALREHWQREVIDESQSTEERTLADLRLPAESSNTCYFAVPLDLVPWYRETLSSVVDELGLVPVFARDVLTPEGTVAVKIDALISRARAVVVDMGSAASMYEAGLALSNKPDAVLFVQPESASLPLDVRHRYVLIRPSDLTSATDEFSYRFKQWLSGQAGTRRRGDEDEADRLLAVGEARAAVVAAVSSLEWQLSFTVGDGTSTRRPVALSRMLREAAEDRTIDPDLYPLVAHALRLRNEALHVGREITLKEAREAVAAIREALRQLQSRS